MSFDEIKLIDEVKGGNSNAFRLLVDCYKDLVFSVCVQLLKDKMLAEELAQDTFLKAYRNISSYRGESKFSTWLYKIAYNSCLSELRKNKIPIVDLEIINYGQSENNGEKLLMESERDNQIKRMLSQLKKEEGLFIQLFYLQEMSIKEIALICDASESNVKVKLHRAKKKLKDIIEGDFPELNRKVAF
jgi:RNA polymerase sigma-70 factor (ECF subfamily)